jgi:pimeloyl-ACP methyl ester carboxylesterase
MAGARERLIFVHGLWLTGIESLWLRRRLQQRHGYEVEVFSYGTRVESLDSVLDRLQRLIAQGDQITHLLGHSLGGRIVLKYLMQPPAAQSSSLPDPLPDQVGRAVLMGSPVAGSRAARVLCGYRWGRQIIGEAALQQLLVSDADVESLPREVGVIAGSLPLGLGGLLAGFAEPNDGTVALSETMLAAARDRIVLPVSHMGMLVSDSVVDAIASFCRSGHFPLQSVVSSVDRKR